MKRLNRMFMHIGVLVTRFQAVLVGFFVLGLIEWVAYSDVITVSLMYPGVAPFLIILLLLFGCYRYMTRRRKRPKE